MLQGLVVQVLLALNTCITSIMFERQGFSDPKHCSHTQFWIMKQAHMDCWMEASTILDIFPQASFLDPPV